MSRIIAVLLFIGYSMSAFGADITNDDLTKACDQKTIVMNKEGNRVGEHLDSFCVGYLQATLAALINTAKTKCTSSLIHNDQTPESLLSIYLTYRKDNSVAGSAAASTTVLAADQRAFDCESK